MKAGHNPIEPVL